MVALNGIGISGTAPQANYVLQYDDVNLMWTPKALPSGNPALGGDLSGVASSGTVVKLRGYALSTSVPTSGQLMGYNGTNWGLWRLLRSIRRSRRQQVSSPTTADSSLVSHGARGDRQANHRVHLHQRCRVSHLGSGANFGPV